MRTDIKLGDKVRDKITGVTGIATSRTEFLNGCIQYEITRRVKKGESLTSDSIQGINVDEQQIEVIKVKKRKIKKSNEGGPMRVKTFYNSK